MVNFSDSKNSPRGYIVGELLQEATRLRAESRTSAAFPVLWMSFNAWGSLVTGETADGAMVEQLAADPDLAKAFAELFERDEGYATSVREFAVFWPLFSNSDIGAHNEWPRLKQLYDAGREAVAKYLIDKYENKQARRVNGRIEGGVRRRPLNKSVNRSQPSWQDCLEAIYMVRNNVIHGTKMYDAGDSEIIASGYETLSGLVTKGGVYGWGV